MNQKNFSLKAKENYSRLDHFLCKYLTEFSRSQIAKWIKEGHIHINDQPVSKKSFPIEAGDLIAISIPIAETDPTEYRPSTSIHQLKLYEDQYLLIINKPSGISVHPGSGPREETLLDIFQHDYPQVAEIDTGDEQQRPGIVHRLDKETSGVMLLAKDIITMRRLQKQFKRREVHKTYLALVSGDMRFRNGTIDASITRSGRQRTKFITVDKNHQGMFTVRDAVTRYHVIRQYKDFAYVKAFPLTGRTHQIRVHFAHLGNPVLGDPLYGKDKNFPRLALHAYSIEFRHPITEAHLIAYSPAPLSFRELLKSS